jgi:CheY-like chemotaxis protein/HPt (histidine-containing phosphotransfer) domain-containing protein
MGQQHFTSRMNMTDAEREHLLNRLDQAARAEPASGAAETGNRRRHMRFEYRMPNTGLTVEHPGGGISRLMVCARNISAGGLGFLHGGYLHRGSRCKVLLRGADGHIYPLGGQIVTCRHVEGVLHEIGLQFDRRIDPSKFVKGPSTASKSAESVGVEQLSGSVLYIDGSVDDQSLMKFVIDMCGAQLSVAPNGADGLALAKREKFNVILAELLLPDIAGIELAQQLKQAGTTAVLVALTADETPSLKAEALAKGFESVLYKPLDTDDLIKSLKRHLPVRPAQIEDKQPLYSSRWDDTRMRPLILEFLARLPAQIEQIEKCLETDAATVRKIALAIKGSAGGYGFPQLTAAAEELRKISASAGKPPQARPALETLKHLCAAARLVTELESAA